MDGFFLLWCIHAKKLTKAEASKPDGIVVPRITGVFLFFFFPVEGDPVILGNPDESVSILVVASHDFPDVHKSGLPVTLLPHKFFNDHYVPYYRV